MKKMLKIASLSTAAALLVSCGTTSSSTSSSADSTIVVDTQVIKGNFYEGFGNTTEDSYVKSLLHGRASTVYISAVGELKINPTYVKEYTKEQLENGDYVYTVYIQDGLKWSDGEPLTASDYLFSILLRGSDEYASVGATTVVDGSILGDAAYKDGIKYENYEAYLLETKEASAVLANAEEGSEEYTQALAVITQAKEKYGEAAGENGVYKGYRLLADKNAFQVIVDKEFVPYFYELVYAAVEPTPMHTLAPGATIESSEDGAELIGLDLDAISSSIIAEDGYLHNPSVVAGAYVLDKFENGEVILKLNPNYAGNHEGKKPEIETLIFRGNSNNLLSGERLLNGEVDIITNVSEAEIVQKLSESEMGVKRYERLGYGYMAMAFSDTATKDVHVRHALAHLIDRQSLISSFLGAGNGVAVNGEYALAQWMYIENKEALNELNSYDYSIDEANKELDQSEYKYQSDGVTPWEVGTGSRYNANKEELVIKHFGTENNPVTEALKSDLTTNSEKVGIKYESSIGDWNALIDQYYYWSKLPKGERSNLFNLATTFTAVYDPYLTNASYLAGTPTNALEIADEQLDEISLRMRKLEPTQRDEYSQLWLEYQKRYNELIPYFPLYSNIYRDYYNPNKIAELPTTSFLNVANVIEDIKLK